MSDSSLPDLVIEQLRDEGLLAGAGSFTLSSEQALRGLDRRPGLQLLKFVQFAVASGCRRLEIRLGKYQLEVVGSGGDSRRPEVEAALKGPFQPRLGRAVAHLAWGIVLASPFERLEMTVDGGHFDGKQWLDSAGGDGFRLRLTRADGWTAGLRNFRQISQEHQLLCQHCCYAPIPILLDGRIINNPERLDLLVARGALNSPSGFSVRRFNRSEILVERNWLSPTGILGGLPGARTVRYLQLADELHEIMPNSTDYNHFGTHVMAVHLCQWLGIDRLPVHHSTRPEPEFYPMGRADSLTQRKVLSVSNESFTPYQSEILSRPQGLIPLAVQRFFTSFEDWDRHFPRVSLRLLLPLGLSGPSRMICVLDGVALEACSLEMPNPGWVVLAAADHLQTDLSQLRPVADASLARLQAHAQAQAVEMLSDFWKARGNRYPQWVVKHMISNQVASPSDSSTTG